MKKRSNQSLYNTGPATPSLSVSLKGTLGQGFRVTRIVQRLITLFFFGILFSSCGSETIVHQVSMDEVSGEGGYIHLAISNSKSTSNELRGAIASYRLMLEGADFEKIERTFTKETVGALVRWVPAGTGRKITVAALNKEGEVLREGVAENVTIASGTELELPLELKSIPYALNRKSGDTISNQRLFFRILTDPGHRVSVESVTSGSANKSLLTDLVVAKEEIIADANGIAKFYGPVVDAGQHQFLLTDLETGKTREITLNFWEGGGMKAAPFFSASKVSGGSRLGQGVAGEKEAGTFANIVRSMQEVQ